MAIDAAVFVALPCRNGFHHAAASPGFRLPSSALMSTSRHNKTILFGILHPEKDIYRNFLTMAKGERSARHYPLPI
jgi:hypothetical protein